MKRTASCQVPNELAGQSILAFLTHRFTYHSAGQWKEHLQHHRVLRNGEPVGPNEILHGGDVLTYIGFDQTEPVVRTDFDILYEDAHLLVIDKPANLPCHPGGRYFNHTLWALLKAHRKEAFMSFVNRIDRETSGIVLVVKSPSAEAKCRRQFSQNMVQKNYYVGVEGVFPAHEMTTSGYLVKDEASVVRKKKKYVPDTAIPGGVKNAHACKTYFSRCACRDGLSLVAARPITGRTHQIRATLCTMGYPVVGDKLYGVDDTLFLRFIEDCLDDDDRRRLRLDRQALHAASLLMRHPHTGRPIKFEAPLPKDMGWLSNGITETR